MTSPTPPSLEYAGPVRRLRAGRPKWLRYLPVTVFLAAVSLMMFAPLA
ncbi:unnamed protein product, partial [marine sediment metagenome]